MFNGRDIRTSIHSVIYLSMLKQRRGVKQRVRFRTKRSKAVTANYLHRINKIKSFINNQGKTK